jgi:carbonic anhydrase/acetyltransferase-like protein (isoleucine patch superfamily)
LYGEFYRKGRFPEAKTRKQISGTVRHIFLRRCAGVAAMDIRAILLTGVPSESDSDCGASESFSRTPLSLLPVLGWPVLHRVAERLRSVGIEPISVLHAGDSGSALLEDSRTSDLSWKDVPSDQIWRAAEEAFEAQGQAGAELIIVIRLGAYAEVELDPLIQFHLDQRNHITQVVGSDGPLDFFVLSASRRNDAAFLFRHKLGNTRVQTEPFLTRGYVNGLRTPADLRALAFDSLMQKTSIQPVAEQIRPGIWVASGARVDRNVRLVAPCYIGTLSRIRSGSLITRGSSIEHHCVVDCGSVVEASTLLPLSYLGGGLDLAHSVLGSKRIYSVKHGAELEVEDASLVSTLPTTSIARTLNHAANLVTFVPRQIIQSLFGQRKQRESQINSTSGTFDATVVAQPVIQDRTLPSSVVAGMREYGNQ